jgi:hypothetical protein
MPTTKEMFFNLTGTAADAYKMLIDRGILLTDEETMYKRIDICVACPHYITQNVVQNKCEICGCGMKMKVRVAAASCPIKKWDKWTPPTSPTTSSLL